MRNYTPAQYKKAAVIVHGKSERFLASYIYTNLHLPVRIIDSNKCKSSIQINGLQKVSTNAMAKLGRDEDVRVEVLIRICACLGCTMNDILDIVPDNTELQTQ